MGVSGCIVSERLDSPRAPESLRAFLQLDTFSMRAAWRKRGIA